ncbi:nucleotidyltransferase domain-containing protein [Thermus thermophilus]|uniref:nucleotidyltransferase domain-containing protein n=1 Tax=Thermus thermophilus TaxID=274 RepID=UPI003B987C0A
MLRWPSREEVEEALKAWLSRHPIPGLVAAGYFGSYARGEAGAPTPGGRRGWEATWTSSSW